MPLTKNEREELVAKSVALFEEYLHTLEPIFGGVSDDDERYEALFGQMEKFVVAVAEMQELTLRPKDRRWIAEEAVKSLMVKRPEVFR